MMNKVVAIIPSRYKSSRFPGKALVKLKGKEMIIRVAEIAEKALGKENVYVATDSSIIADVVRENGFNVVMTSEDCMTGTDRVAEAAKQIDADVIINVQGDEPLLDPNDIIKVMNAKVKYPNHIINCVSPMNDFEEGANPKFAKIVSNLNGEMMYISRASIPATKSGDHYSPMKNVSIYGFNKEHLEGYSSVNGRTPLESIEDIETLRFLELGYKIKLVEVDGGSYSIDYPVDVEIVENLLG